MFEGSRGEVDEGLLARMRDAMVHRGPDGAGLWISPDRRMGLGHRRLSIIDLSEAASQPMTNEDGSLWVAFNGEIYNHAAIRRELEAAGRHRFRTDHSDTEVILHAFEEWGIECLERFRGMFAFALWDDRRGELWLVRDRIGIKPLYYGVHHGRITFASEIKALLVDPHQPREVDEESFYHYLTFLTSPPGRTMFRGIHKVPPGTWLRIGRSGAIVERRYWDVWDHAAPMTGCGEDEIAERVLDELRTSVRLRKESDVPVGVFLSGGIDSSTNAALFSEGEKRPIRTFTIGYDRDYPTYASELHHARFMAGEVGAEHHEKVLSVDDVCRFLPEMVRLQDEPLGDPVCVPLYYVSELARKTGVIVCQVGEGADELFWGYPPWKRMLHLEQANRLPVPASFKRLGLRGLRLLGKQDRSYFEWLRRGAAGQSIFWGGTDAVDEGLKRQLLSPRMRERFEGVTSWDVLAPIRRRFEDRAWETSDVNWMSYVDLQLRLPELMLMRVDKMSMAASVECRVPFLDHRFVELAMGIPQSLKTRHGVLKYVLKKAVRGLIPDQLIDRKKQGFHAPVAEWLMERLREPVRRELIQFSRQTDFLDSQAVERLFDEGRGMKLWYLFNFALWWKEYMSGTPARRPVTVESN